MIPIGTRHYGVKSIISIVGHNEGLIEAVIHMQGQKTLIRGCPLLQLINCPTNRSKAGDAMGCLPIHNHTIP
jgi:hypothetical protein